MCPSLKATPVTAATDPQSPTPLPTTTMPYSNCVPFKQGPLVHGNGPVNGNMVCTPKCCMVGAPNGLVITSDFKSIDINKMSLQANSQHVNNNHQKKHSSVAELVNYKNGHEVASGDTSHTKTVLLLQSNLNSSQPPSQQHYHTCKSLKCEKLATTSIQANNSAPISSSSQVPTGTSPTACVNCNKSVKSTNNANMTSLEASGTNGKLVSKKCKALHNLQCKFQKNRFISSLQDCCRACNNYDRCRGSTESLELEAGLLCPSYSYCDSENVTSLHNSKDNHNYKNQLASLASVSPSQSAVLPLSKSNNNCSAAAANNKTIPSNLQPNDFTSSPTSGGLVAGVDTREEDFGDFIEADFPPVATSGRLMSSSTDSTESCSSLTSSDIHDSCSPIQPTAVSPLNNIATSVSDQTVTHGVSSLCSTFFKNCDYKKNNQTSSPSPFQAVATAAATYPSPMVTGANPSLKKCSKKTPPNSHSPLPATCLSELGDGNSVKQEQASSVIKCSDVSKMSSSFLSSSSLSLQSPASTPSSSSSSSPSSASFPTCSFLCSGDRHSHAKHKADKNTSSGSSSRYTADTTTNQSGNSCHNSMPSPLPLAGISAACVPTGPNSSTQQPSATFLLSPEVDFLDFDLVTPNMDSEQNINSAGSSNGTTGFDLSLDEIPYADDVDSACPSPAEDLSPNMVIGAAGGNYSSTSHPVLANCATNDLSASSSNSNLSGRSTLEDAILPHGHSNLETVRTRVQNAFSNLYLDYRDDISVDSEETGSHDSNEISEGDDQHPSHHHHRRHHCGLTHSAPNGSLNNNLLLLISPDSIASSQDIDLR